MPMENGKDRAREIFGRLVEAQVARVTDRRLVPTLEFLIKSNLEAAGYDWRTEKAFTEGLNLSGGKRQYDEALNQLTPVHA